jgi:polar amino acid transport system permease protein
VIDLLWQYRQAFQSGLGVTLQLAGIAWMSGLVVGSVLAIAAVRYPRLVGTPLRTASFLLSAIPVLVLLFWVHYPVQRVLGVVVNPFLTAAVVLSVTNVLTVESVVGSGVRALPREYLEAARVLGLSRRATLVDVELPIVVRHIAAPLLVTQIAVLHATLFASLISVNEVLRMAQRVNAIVYQPVEIYTALGLLFLFASLPPLLAARRLQARYGRDYSER